MRAIFVILGVALLAALPAVAAQKDAAHEDFDVDTEGTEELDDEDLQQFSEEYEQQGGQGAERQEMTPEQRELEARFQREFLPYLLSNVEEDCRGEIEKVLAMSPEEQATLPNPPFSPDCHNAIRANQQSFQQIFVEKLRAEAGIDGEGQPGEGQQAGQQATVGVKHDAGSPVLTIAIVLTAVAAAFGGVAVYAISKSKADTGKKAKKPSSKKAK